RRRSSFLSPVPSAGPATPRRRALGDRQSSKLLPVKKNPDLLATSRKGAHRRRWQAAWVRCNASAYSSFSVL
uniref:Uncharacterized protein n=1 Tax=Aegilops tauschii subsp. strangulata TaxID=200361 RepID=A0A453MM75_AEGTS